MRGLAVRQLLSAACFVVLGFVVMGCALGCVVIDGGCGWLILGLCCLGFGWLQFWVAVRLWLMALGFRATGWVLGLLVVTCWVLGLGVSFWVWCWVCIGDCCCRCEWFCCSYASGFAVGSD